MPPKKTGPFFDARSRSLQSSLRILQFSAKARISSLSLRGCPWHSISKVSVPVAESSAFGGSMPEIDCGEVFAAEFMYSSGSRKRSPNYL